MTINFSLICQIRDFGSGHPDSYRDLQPRQIRLSTVPIAIRMAKIAPWWLARRDSFLAKVPGLFPVLASGNTPSLHAGTFAKIACKAISLRSVLHIAGPLAARQICPKSSLHRDFRRTHKCFAALPFTL